MASPTSTPASEPKAEDSWMNFGAGLILFGTLILILGIFDYELILVSLFFDTSSQTVIGAGMVVAGVAVILVRNRQGIPLTWALRERRRSPTAGTTLTTFDDAPVT